jgi:two-component system cell cycle sensor histidine kinase/response regulator CckA
MNGAKEQRMQNSASEQEGLIRDLRRNIAVMQKEQAENSRLYQALLEMSPDMMFIIGRDEKYYFVNNPAASLADRKPADMVGRRLREFFPPDIAEYHLERVRRVFETGEPVVNEVPFLLPPRQIWAESRMIPVKNSSGEVISVLCITRDVTDQKLAENALRESEERFKQVIEQMPYPVEIFSPDGTAVMVNTAFLELMKIPSSELVIGKYNLFTDPIAAEIGIIDEVRKAFAGATVYFSELAFSMDKINKDYFAGKNVTVFLDTTVFPVYLMPGELFHVVVIYKDITERRQAQRALQENEKKMRTQYKCFPVPTYTWQNSGDDFILVDFNDAALHFTAGALRNLLGKKLSEVFRHDPKVLREMTQCLNERTVVTAESSYVFPISKTEKYLNVTYVFVEPDLVMVHTEDITEKQKLEQEIRRAEHLESIGLLAGGIAHDFNNLLAGIFGYISLAREYGKTNENVKDSLDKAMLVFGQAKALTQQLLTFSKGGSPVRKLASIAEILSDMCAFVLAGSDVKAEPSFSGELWNCEVDTGQLSEVINNVLINAQQAMPGGGVIDITAENYTVHEHRTIPLKPGRYVKIGIQDHGIGIAEKHLSRVFDPFFSTKQQGSGLGLTIAYSIIKRHEGHIEVQSQPGKGTLVRIYLPASNQAALSPVVYDGELRTGHGRILLMDDEEFLLDAIGKVITSLGYRVEGVRNGHDAVEVYKKEKLAGEAFDAVILDLTIPGGMGGKQAMQEIQRIDPGVRAIATSGYSEDPVIADPRSSGFRGALRKPYSIEELSLVIQKVLSEP